MCSGPAHVRFPAESDIKCDIWVRFGPKADIAPLIRSPSAVVRPLTREPCWRSTVRDLAAVEGALAHLSQFNILRATVRSGATFELRLSLPWSAKTQIKSKYDQSPA